MITSLRLEYAPAYERNEFSYVKTGDDWNHSLQLNFTVDQSKHSYEIDRSRYYPVNYKEDVFVPHNILFCGTDTDLCDTLLATFTQTPIKGNTVTDGVLEIETSSDKYAYSINCTNNIITSTLFKGEHDQDLSYSALVNRVLADDSYIDRVHYLPGGFVNEWSANFGKYIKACYDINADEKLTFVEYVNDCWFVRYHKQSDVLTAPSVTKPLCECDRTIRSIALLTFAITSLETNSGFGDFNYVVIPARLIDTVDGITKHRFVNHLNRISTNNPCHQAFVFTNDCSLMHSAAFDADNVFIITRNGRQWVRCSDTSNREFRYANHMTNLYLGRAFDVA